MLSFLAMLFTFRLGLGAAPVDGAVASLRHESLAVAARHAEDADRVTVRSAELSGSFSEPAPQAMSQRDWEQLLARAIQNAAVANAATWLASQPLRVNVTGEKFVLSVRVATP